MGLRSEKKERGEKKKNRRAKRAERGTGVGERVDKAPDSRENFVVLPKQAFLELSQSVVRKTSLELRSKLI